MANAFVGGTPATVYVVIDHRTIFDKISRPVSDHGAQEMGHVLTKTVEQDGVLVIFQHWIEQVGLAPGAVDTGDPSGIPADPSAIMTDDSVARRRHA